jgi:hypothetical protein
MEERICFSFKYLSMALRNKKDLDGMFVGFFGEESFETNLIVVFVFVCVMIDCIFVSECRYRLIVSEFWM